MWGDVFGGTTRSLIIEAELSDGRVGSGEATLLPSWSGEWTDSSRVLLDQVLSPALVDQPATDRIAETARAALAGNGFLVWATETAVRDALGARAETATIPIRGLIGRVAPDVAHKLAGEQTDEGYERLKVKLEGVRDNDEERLRAVRDAAPSATIVADANESLPYDQLDTYARLFKRLSVEAVEQPCARTEVLERSLPAADGWAWVADESIWGYDDALAIKRGPWHAWTLHPGKSRGEDSLSRIADVASEHGIALVLGSNGEFAAGADALCRIAADLPFSQLQEQLGHDLGGPLLADGWSSASLSLTGGAIHQREEP